MSLLKLLWCIILKDTYVLIVLLPVELFKSIYSHASEIIIIMQFSTFQLLIFDPT